MSSRSRPVNISLTRQTEPSGKSKSSERSVSASSKKNLEKPVPKSSSKLDSRSKKRNRSTISTKKSNISKKKSRETSLPVRKRSSLKKVSPTDPCLAGPDFYANVLGPTADETILVGLETFIKFCQDCPDRYVENAIVDSGTGLSTRDSEASSVAQSLVISENNPTIGEQSGRNTSEKELSITLAEAEESAKDLSERKSSGRGGSSPGRGGNSSIREGNVSEREENLFEEDENSSEGEDFYEREDNLSGRERNLSGRERNLSGRERNLSGRKRNLSGREENLSGRQENLSGRERSSSGRESPGKEISGRSVSIASPPNESSSRNLSKKESSKLSAKDLSEGGHSRSSSKENRSASEKDSSLRSSREGSVKEHPSATEKQSSVRLVEQQSKESSVKEKQSSTETKSSEKSVEQQSKESSKEGSVQGKQSSTTERQSSEKSVEQPSKESSTERSVKGKESSITERQSSERSASQSKENFEGKSSDAMYEEDNSVGSKEDSYERDNDNSDDFGNSLRPVNTSSRTKQSQTSSQKQNSELQTSSTASSRQSQTDNPEVRHDDSQTGSMVESGSSQTSEHSISNAESQTQNPVAKGSSSQSKYLRAGEAEVFSSQRTVKSEQSTSFKSRSDRSQSKTQSPYNSSTSSSKLKDSGDGCTCCPCTQYVDTSSKDAVVKTKVCLCSSCKAKSAQKLGTRRSCLKTKCKCSNVAVASGNSKGNFITNGEKRRVQLCDCKKNSVPASPTVESNGTCRQVVASPMGDTNEGCVKVRYAITKITKYYSYTTFEVMRSTRKKPRVMPKALEGVFVLKNSAIKKDTIVT